ncbi:hypothetical protein AVEN_150355-1 [Araneus ventricosus]|uniref:Uncharacterized protein n=1 Tax=Araneus ventricosus TaxID=182803 RepID=A0A4Y2CRH5_ARAVE|nr:hypothetical protein AVEN_150355-1 [Araneus ventricosus]
MKAADLYLKPVFRCNSVERVERRDRFLNPFLPVAGGEDTQSKGSYFALQGLHEGYFRMDLESLNRGQMWKMTPEPAAPLQTSALHQWQPKINLEGYRRKSGLELVILRSRSRDSATSRAGFIHFYALG